MSTTTWQQVGASESPVPESPIALKVSKLREGDGVPVAPGDLVRINIAAKDGLFEPSVYSREMPRPHVIWLWTGREPSVANYDAFMAWGSPGSGRLRGTLIGKPVGSRFEVQLERDSDYIVEIPISGMTVHRGSTNADGGEDRWPSLNFSRASTIAEIEIVEACPAWMLRRSATMKQAGYILNMFDMHYGKVRSGTLTWSALEANCPGRTDKLRLEIGPLYFARSARLYNWPYSYRELSQERFGWMLLGLSLPGWLAIGVGIAGVFALGALSRKRNRQA